MKIVWGLALCAGIASLSMGVAPSLGMGMQHGAGAPAGTKDPQTAVRIAVQSSGPCFQINFTATARCPITYRLHQRIRVFDDYTRKHFRTGPPNFLCRCQGGEETITGTVMSGGSRAVVTAAHGATNHITFVLLRWRAGWLIDDTYCTGHPTLDLYHQNLPGLCA